MNRFLPFVKKASGKGLDLSYLKPEPVADYAFPDERVRFGRQSMKDYFCPEFPAYKEECAKRGSIEVPEDPVQLMHAFDAAGAKGMYADAAKHIARRVMFRSLGGASAVGAVAYAEKYGGASEVPKLGTTITMTSRDTAVLHTPADIFRKQWVCGAASPAVKEALVAGELIDESGASRGSCYVKVRIRNDAGRPVDGVSVESMPDFPELEFATLGFKNVAVRMPNGVADAISSGEDLYEQARMTSAAYSLGDCKRQLRQALHGARATYDEHDALGRKVTDLEPVKAAVAKLLSEVIAVHHLHVGAVAAVNPQHTFPRYMYGDAAKIAASELAVKVHRTVQGWRGLAEQDGGVLPPELATLWPGDNAVLLQGLARDYLDYSSENPRHYIEERIFAFRQRHKPPQGFLWSWANAPGCGWRISDPPADSLSHLEWLLTHRVKVLVFELRTEMETLISNGPTSAARTTAAEAHWTRALPDRTAQFSRAYIDLLAFLNTKNRVLDAPLLVRPTLTAWLTLYGMQAVQGDLAWYLADGAVSPSLADALGHGVRRYAADLIQDAPDLLECL
eukprot:TRINITY_DN15365_c0_g2_i1.p1 TRINITY_DN15365_c0_g2~~TRINITY_DN15365_c0_g2_i1.p1  ORF type:complete len:564 (+),score=167.29 TRINITY_DN15365_c0_g2_i1:69-1760(+)